MTKSIRSYFVALVVLGFFYVVVIGEFALLLRSRIASNDGLQSNFAFEFVIFFSSLYLAVIALILLISNRWWVQGQWILTALNIILLFSVPFGTILGGFYLWKLNGRSDGSMPPVPPTPGTE